MSKFESEIYEPEEVNVDFNPLDEPVNEKRYTSPNVNANPNDLNKPIEEPRFAPPPMQKKTIPQFEEKKPKPEPFNPEMRNIPKKETEMAASQMAKLIIGGYEWMHQFANKGLMISEKRLLKLQAEGEINLNAMIDYDYGKKVRAGEFFQDYNEQVKDIFYVSESFKQEVTPVLERVLAKRGVGMTDENYLMVLFAKDIADKSIIFFQYKSQLNGMIESIKAATMSQYAEQSPMPPPPPRQPQQQAPPTPPPTPEPVIATEPEEVQAEVVKAEVVAPAPRKRGRPKG
jgi:hypothetical protein